MRTIEERLWAKVDKSGNCWLWLGSKKPDGYAQMHVNGARQYVHRISYAFTHGAIPAGMVVDHVCHTRSCVRPSHLRLVTPKQNSENISGAYRSNKLSGVRGVHWDAPNRKWVVRVVHNYARHSGGSYLTIQQAEKAAIALRNKLFTHNDLDRIEK